ncbi:hypothetical protein [Actinomadura flavalba]|uniref:hypothetical protein n=1 Tax=Actinomadura flavalba TaxID=1120938 RepID=UPI00039B357F|nr:hypothetical protein [Actinomadura flavalba]
MTHRGPHNIADLDALTGESGRVELVSGHLIERPTSPRRAFVTDALRRVLTPHTPAHLTISRGDGVLEVEAPFPIKVSLASLMP